MLNASRGTSKHMPKEPDLTLITFDTSSKEIISEFTKLIQIEQLSPSQALHRVMTTYEMKEIDPFTVEDMVKAAYPDSGVQHVAAQLFEKNYPQTTEYMTDKDFDQLVLTQI